MDGGNGVYAYGGNGAFPSSTFNSENYWVDVVFSTTLPPDTTPPTVSSVTPVSAATGVSGNPVITATFSEPIDPTSVSTSSFELRNPANALVTATVTYDGPSRTATLHPTATLAYNTPTTRPSRAAPAARKARAA